MNREQVKEITNIAMSLKSGESMSIEVPSLGQGYSLRTMFYRERKKILDKGIAFNVSLSSIELKEDKQWIAIFKYEEVPKVVIHKADGSYSAISLEVKAPPVMEDEIPEEVAEILKKHRKMKEERDDTDSSL